MPRKGEINRAFGVYKNVCCGAEIVIPENVTFPGCATHSHHATEWKNTTQIDRVSHLSELFAKRGRDKDGEEDPAA
jgi:hypothetical protein